MREVFPDTREQRCWWHKQANVLAALPKSAHPGALAALKEIYNAEDIDKARVAIKAFEIDYGAKYPKAVAKIVADADVLLEFYRYPAEHWIHLAHDPNRCTVYDRRASTSLVAIGYLDQRQRQSWPHYLTGCRALVAESGRDLRKVDRALFKANGQPSLPDDQ